MRHFAATLYLTEHPEGIEVVRRVLGHRSADTTHRSYAGVQDQVAVRRFDELVADEKITPERRDEILTNAQPMIERAVDLHRGESRDQLDGAESDAEASPATTSSEALVA